MRGLEHAWRRGRVLYVEALSPAGRAFGEAHGLRLTPSFILFDAEGRPVRVWTGALRAPTPAELDEALR